MLAYGLLDSIVLPLLKRIRPVVKKRPLQTGYSKLGRLPFSLGSPSCTLRVSVGLTAGLTSKVGLMLLLALSAE